MVLLFFVTACSLVGRMRSVAYSEINKQLQILSRETKGKLARKTMKANKEGNHSQRQRIL